MTYEQAISHIHSLEVFGSKPGLSRITELLRRLGDPQKALKCIHVAGTNGKGSTCTMLSNILSCAGYRTGLTISPYVLDFRERIQLNNEMISKAELTKAVYRIAKAAEGMSESPTEFEFITALALDYFHRMEVDIAVIETGLGGRFDATNVFDSPLVSVITAISMDHAEVLGDTVEKIAAEKCGIIKPASPVVAYPVQPDEAAAIIRATAKKNSADLIIPKLNSLEVLKEDLRGNVFAYQGKKFETVLAGRHQIYNALTVLEAVSCLKAEGFEISEESIAEGLSASCFPARTEMLSCNPPVILDGAHNLDGILALVNTLSPYFHEKSLVLIIGMLKDKAYDDALRLLSPFSKHIITVPVPSPRALPPKVLAAHATRYSESVYCAADYDDAIANADLNLGDGGMLICGSLYLAAEIRDKAKKYVSKFQKNA